jgi:hypothetical protein
MRNCRRVFVISVLLFLAGSSFGASVDPKHATVPLIFERNVGQAPSSYAFVSRHGAVESLLSSSTVDIVVPDGKTTARIRFRLLDSCSGVVPEARQILPSVTNYLVGNDPARWLRGVLNSGQVFYAGVYSGIDLVFHGQGDQLEHDFRIAAGADASQVRFAIEGGNGIRVNSNGDLEVALESGTLYFRKPQAFQETLLGRQAISADFVLNADNSVQFQIGPYDRSRALVIDPVFSFSTYLAGSTADYPVAVTTDLAGNIYVTGYTYSMNFPIVDGIETAYNGSPDAFVSKLDPTGHTLLYSTYLGGSSRNYGNAIAVDSSGNIVIAGTSSSNDFPHAGSIPALTCEGNNDCFFIASLNPSGSAFNYSGLVGGTEGTGVQSGQGVGNILALDASGNAYLSSITDDSKFEITPGTLATTVPGYPYSSTFVLKVDTKGALAYSTIVPGIAEQDPTIYLNNEFLTNGISIDSAGNATIAGTAGPGLPSTDGVIQPAFPNPSSENASAGFVLQINSKASAINYATYVTGTDLIGGLAVDSSGNSYLTGGTSEPNLPVSTNAYQKTLKTGSNCTCNSGFVLKLNSTGTAVLAATYLEGTPAEGNEGTNFTGIGLDSSSNVFVGGMTASTDFPLKNPFVSLLTFGDEVVDMILAGLSPDLSSLLFGSFLSSTDQIYSAPQFAALRIDHTNNLIVIGYTAATDFPTTPGSYQPAPPTQANHGFIAKLDMAVSAPSFCPASWSLNFGDVAAKKSATQVLNVKNCGNATLHVKSVVSSVATVTAANGCAAVSAGATCTVRVIFAPRDSSLTSGALTFSDDTAISPQAISFSGQGVAPHLSPSSGSINFGHLLVNTTGIGNSLLFWNYGNAPLVISSVSVDGDFSITENSCDGTIQPNNLCVMSLTFSAKAAGVLTGTLSIDSNDPVSPRTGISLVGFGDAAYAPPVITSLSSPTVQIKNGIVTVQVYGSNFYPASVIEVNGKPQATTYSSGGQIQASLDSTVTNAIGEIRVSVSNPTPGGGTTVGLPLTRYNVVDIDAAFLASVPGSPLLYASILSSAPTNPNTVVAIDPVTGATGKPIPVGNNPGVLVASADGKYLFVAANQDQTLQRINLATHAVDETFPFPPNGTSCCGALVATDLKVVPGTTEVVLALDIPEYGFGEMALYNDSGLVNYIPASSEGSLSFSSFGYAGSPTTIYSLPFTSAPTPFFNVVNITPQGLQYSIPACCYGTNSSTGAEVVSDDTLLYTSAGEVWNPASQTQVGSFPVTTYNDTSYPNIYNLVMDEPSGHIFVIGDEPIGVGSASLVLSAYGKQSLALTGALAFPQVSSPIVSNLVRWGTEGFAFIVQDSTPYPQPVYLLTSSLANAVSANPVPKVFSLAPTSVPRNSPVFGLILNGAGFTESSVINWNGAAMPTTYISNNVLTTLIPGANLSTSGIFPITVTNPSPGGGTSNSVRFDVAPLTPLISLSSSAVSFGKQKVGTSSNARLVAVQNPGTASLKISSVKIAGPGAASFQETNNCGSMVATGANCSLSIVFTPASVGALTAKVTFTDNATGSPQVVSVTGTGD